MYQSAPSGPRVIRHWVEALAALNCVMTPAVVMRPTLPVPVNQSAPSGPEARLVPTALSPPGTGNSVMHSDGLATQPPNFVRSIRAIRPVWSTLPL